MSNAIWRRLSQLGYDRARLLLLAAGFAILLVVVVTTYVRRVETVEVVATLLFVPIFLGVVFGRLWGGFILSLLASATYLLLRYPTVDAIGWGDFTGIVASRTSSFVLFGVIAGWADQTLEAALHKLELYDHVEDTTGLRNAWFFLEETEYEMARSDRFDQPFSVVVHSFPDSALASLSRRRTNEFLDDLGTMLKGGARDVDQLVFATDAEEHDIAAVLPQTDREEADRIASEMLDHLVRFFSERGVALAESEWRSEVVTYPADAVALEVLRERFHHLDEFEHGHVHVYVPVVAGGADA